MWPTIVLLILAPLLQRCSTPQLLSAKIRRELIHGVKSFVTAGRQIFLKLLLSLLSGGAPELLLVRSDGEFPQKRIYCIANQLCYRLAVLKGQHAQTLVVPLLQSE